jgi:cytidylate kinase
MKIIGFAGQMGSGKTTLAEFLMEHLRGEAKQRGYSEHSIDIVGIADGIRNISQILWGDDPRVRTDKMRIRLQKIGEAMRKIDESVWLNYLERNARMSLGRDGTIIMADVRVPEEARWIFNNGGILIFVNTNSKLRKKRLEIRDNYYLSDQKWSDMNNHSTEKGVEMIGQIYCNPPDAPNVAIFNNNNTLGTTILLNEFVSWYKHTFGKTRSTALIM